MYRKALFLHTQKTAGTSIQEMARRCYGNDGVASHGDYVELKIDGCAKLPFVSGHFGIEFARHLMDGRYCFTFLRDPIDRLISLHAFLSTRESDEPVYRMARQQSLDGFLRLALVEEDFRQRLWNHQVWQLAWGWGAFLAGGRRARITDFPPDELLAAAKENLDAFDYVGFVETFDRDATTIFRALGCAHPTPRRSNVSRKRPEPRDLPASTKDVLLEITALDQDLYDYARHHFAGKAVDVPDY